MKFLAIDKSHHHPIPHLLANMVHMRATTAGANGIHKAHLCLLEVFIEGASRRSGILEQDIQQHKKTKDVL